MLWRYICPPDPGRNADHLRQLENTVSGSAAVATGDDERVVDIRNWIFDRYDQITFPFPSNLGGVDLAAFSDMVDHFVFAQRADNYRVWNAFRRRIRNLRL